MKDIINELESLSNTPSIEFKRIDSDVGIECVDNSPNLYYLYPDEDYCITPENAGTACIHTDVEITAASNVEITAIIPERWYYDADMIVKQTEVIISPNYRGRIDFLASGIFSTRLQKHPDSIICLHPDIPFGYLRVAPVQKVNVKGVKR